MVPATTQGLPEGEIPADVPGGGEAPPSIASSWIDLIDDLGPVVFVDGVDAVDLDRRLAARGARRTDTLERATTVVLGARSLVDPSRLPAEVTVAVLASNPLRMGRGAPGEHPVAADRLGRLRRRLPGATVFGLVPSAERPHLALDPDSPTAARYALGALSLHVADRPRRWLLHRMRAAVRHRRMGRFPGWLLVRHGTSRAGGPRVSAQFAYANSEGLTRFVGEPPQWVEREASTCRIEAERRALAELDGAGGLTPRLWHTERPTVAASLAPGRPLDLRSLSDTDVEAWTERAARVLVRLQRRSLHADGSVLVHGDYWLGNLMVEDDRVVGVVDWEEAHRGDPGVDPAFLATSFLCFSGREADEVLRRRLRAAVDRGVGAGSTAPELGI